MSFFEIFNPGMQHLREERDRRKMLVSRPTHGGGSPLGIDLQGGKAKISLPGHTTSQEVDEEVTGQETTEAPEAPEAADDVEADADNDA